MGCGQNVGPGNKVEGQVTSIAAIIKRAARPPEGQECWDLRKSGGCTECGGFGTVSALACDYHCRRTDHSSCGTKLVPCPFCAGTGLGVVGLFRLLKQIGCIVNVDVKLPGGQYLKE
jgi:hypothetical protein